MTQGTILDTFYTLQQFALMLLYSMCTVLP